MRPARSRAAPTTSRSRSRRCSTRQQRRGRDGGTMGSRIVSRRDLEFQLFEVLDVEKLRERPRFAQHSRETMLAAVDTALAIAEEKVAPHNRKADEHQPTFHGGGGHPLPRGEEAP